MSIIAHIIQNLLDIANSEVRYKNYSSAANILQGIETRLKFTQEPQAKLYMFLCYNNLGNIYVKYTHNQPTTR